MLCEKCHQFQNNKPYKSCDFCARMGFPEDILCCIARNGSEHGSLTECGAYRPRLSLVSSDLHDSITIEDTETDGSVATDKDKWFRAYAKQQMQLNSDQIHFKLQFHVCLVSKTRNAIFSNSGEYFDKIMNIFHQIANSFDNTQIELLSLDSDHIHLYVNSTPDYALDEIVDKLIKVSEKELQSSFPTAVDKFNGVWEAGYFSESIG